VIDFNRGPIEPQRPTQVAHVANGSNASNQSDLIHETLVDCSKFSLERIQGKGIVRVDRENHFTIITVPEGEAILETNRQHFKLGQGSSALLPAALREVYLRCEKPDTVVLLAR
jgi:mannose-6-phosphate isomerase class I